MDQDTQKTCEVRGELAWILRISRVFCISPFRVEMQHLASHQSRPHYFQWHSIKRSFKPNLYRQRIHIPHSLNLRAFKPPPFKLRPFKPLRLRPRPFKPRRFKPDPSLIGSSRRTGMRVCASRRQYFFNCFILIFLNIGVMADSFLVTSFSESARTFHGWTVITLGITAIGQISALAVCNWAVCYGYRRMEFWFQLINCIRKMDIIKSNDRTSDEKHTKLIIISYVGLLSYILALIFETSIYLWDVLNGSPTFIDIAMVPLSIPIYVKGIIAELIQIQVILLMSTLQSALGSLNDELKRLVVNAVNKDCTRGNVFVDLSLSKLARTYTSICEAIREADAQEGGLLTLLILSLTANHLESSYQFCLYALSNSTVEQVYYNKILMRALWAANDIVKMASMACPSYKIDAKVERTRALASRATYGAAAGAASERAARVLADVLLIARPKIAPLRLFTFTSSLWLTVIGISCTNLYTIVQLHVKEKNRD